MTNLYGTGKKGYRLWLRSAIGTWIEVPYGAGQDSYVRSLNIWNAKLKKWMIPVSGRNVQIRENNMSATEIESFEFYAPGRTWLGGDDQFAVLPYWNPNYRSRRDIPTPFSPMHTKWVRLFHVLERPDPKCRIVPLGVVLPKIVPNRTLNWNTSVAPDTTMFWPNVSYLTNSRRVTEGVESFELPIYGAGGTAGLEGIAGAVAEYHPGDFSSGVLEVHPWSFQSVSSGLIDLVAIRQRLNDHFPQQGVDFVGQYDPINDMKVKRVIIHGTVSLDLTITGYTADPVITFGAANANIVAQTYLPSAFPRPFTVGGMTYNVAVPAVTASAGTSIYRKTLADQTFQEDPGFHDINGTLIRINRARIQTALTYIWEDPGETNVGCYASFEAMPADSGIIEWVAGLVFQPDRISIHYATEGHDTPVSTHTWDAIV